jgi:DNA replication protein DnaC
MVSQTYLAELCEQEASEHYQKRLQRYLSEAQLPPAKQLSQFDFRAVTGVDKRQIMSLSGQRQWVRSSEHPASKRCLNQTCESAKMNQSLPTECLM